MVYRLFFVRSWYDFPNDFGNINGENQKGDSYGRLWIGQTV